MQVQVRVDVTAEVVSGVHQVSMGSHGVSFQMVLLSPLKLHLKVVTLRSRKTKESTVGRAVVHQRLVVLMLAVIGAKAVRLMFHGVSSTPPTYQKESQMRKESTASRKVDSHPTHAAIVTASLLQPTHLTPHSATLIIVNMVT